MRDPTSRGHRQKFFHYKRRGQERHGRRSTARGTMEVYMQTGKGITGEACCMQEHTVCLSEDHMLTNTRQMANYCKMSRGL